MKLSLVVSSLEDLLKGKELSKFVQKRLISKVKKAVNMMDKHDELIGVLQSHIFGSPIILDYRKFDEDTYIVKTSSDNYWRTIILSKTGCLTNVSESYEQQLLVTLSNKYKAPRNFGYFTSRMLGDDFIKENE